MATRMERYLAQVDQRNAELAEDDEPQEEQHRENADFVAQLKEGVKMMRQAEKMIRGAAERAVGHGVTWGQIGGLLDLPGEVARQRYGTTPNPGNVQLGSGAPPGFQ